MTTEVFIIESFCRADDEKLDLPTYSQANLYFSEVVTLALLSVLKRVGVRPFYLRLNWDFGYLFLRLPEQARLYRLFSSHRYFTERFMAEPFLFGIVDSSGIELMSPRREGRSRQPIGKKGKSSTHWIVGGKLCFLINHSGLVVHGARATANAHDGSGFQELIDHVADQVAVFAGDGFAKRGWYPVNLKVCKRGDWNGRMIVETLLSMPAVVCHFKKLTHRVWTYFESRLARTMALFNILVQWHGLEPDKHGFVHLPNAEFSL